MKSRFHFEWILLRGVFVTVTVIAIKVLTETCLNIFFPYVVKLFAVAIFEECPNLELGFCSIAVQDILLTRDLLDIVNDRCHDSCHFLKFNIGGIRIRFLPVLSVEVWDVDVRMTALPPGEWSIERVMKALKASRSDIFDLLTDRIDYRKKHPKYRAFVSAVKSLGLSIFDLVLASVRLSIRNLFFGYRCNRSLQKNKNMISVRIEELFVFPVPLSLEYFISTGMKMQYEIRAVSIFCCDSGYNLSCTGIDSPLLEPASVNGSIRLPKILSQMIRQDPLESKFGYLVVEAGSLSINGGLNNLIALSDFSIMLDTYRKWYACVEKTFDEQFKTEEDAMFTYISTYSKYAIESDPKKKSQLRKLYRHLEDRLKGDDIRLSRALALGWFASDFLPFDELDENQHFKLFEHFVSHHQKITEYKDLLRQAYENELWSLKELRKMKVDIWACDIFINLPCFLPPGSSRSSEPAATYRRTTLWLHGTSMHVTEPIVKKSESFDEPRILRGNIERLSLMNSNYSELNEPFRESTITKSSNLPLFGSIQITDTFYNAAHSEIQNLEAKDMIFFNVSEDIWEKSVSVIAELSNSVLVPEMSAILDFAEYGVLAVEDIIRIFDFYRIECQFPNPKTKPSLPVSLLKGERLNIDVIAKNLCFLFTDLDPSNCKFVVLSLDAIAKISSISSKESVEASLSKLRLFSAERINSAVGRDVSSGVNADKLVIRISPSPTHVKYSSLSLFYRLEMRRDFPKQIICPEVAAADLERLHGSGGQGLVSPKKSNSEPIEERNRANSWRWESIPPVWPASIPQKRSVDKAMMLFRDINVLSGPMSVSIAEAEARTVVRWCERTVLDIFPNIVRRSDNKEMLVGNRFSDIQASRLARSLMIEKIRKDEKSHRLNACFQEVDISRDGYLEPEELKLVLKKILEPLHLLRSELEQKVSDIIFSMDCDMDGKVGMAEFRRNLIDAEKLFNIKDQIYLMAHEITGSKVPEYILKGAQLDSGASRKLWNLIERELDIVYSERNLGGKSPVVVQSMLLRLCGDIKLARLIWENVIRPNIRGGSESLVVYSWAIRDDDMIGTPVDFGKLASQFMAKPPANLSNDYEAAEIKELILCSYTRIVVEVSSLTVNIVDKYLGPTVPRFQFELLEISIEGEMMNEGIRPHWSSVSKDAIGVVAKMSLQSSFFNSLVDESEPIVEPWGASCIIRKQDSDGYVDCLVRGDFMTINLSTAGLQTMASTILNIFWKRVMSDIKIASLNDIGSLHRIEEHVDEAHMSRTKAIDATTMRDHVCLIYNLTGCALGLRVSAPNYFQSGADIIVNPASSKYIFIPLLNTSVKSNIFKSRAQPFAQLFVKAFFDNDEISFTQLNPVPLHFLALNSVAICPQGLNNGGKACPALILDMESKAEPEGVYKYLYYDSALLARSNVRIRNSSDMDVWVRLLIDDVSEVNSAQKDTLIKAGEVFFLPIQYVSYLNILNLSLRISDPESSRWTNCVNVQALLLHEKGLEGFDSEASSFFYSTHSFHLLNTIAMSSTDMVLHDHTIDILSGFCMMNALPCAVALKMKYWKRSDTSVLSNADDRVYSISAGEKIWLPLVQKRRTKIRFRIQTEFPLYDGADSTSKWSDEFEFNSTFMDSEHDVELPCATMLQSLKCCLLLSRDLSLLDMSSDIPSAPTLFLFSTIWVQNNSSIPLKYKFGRGAMERSVVLTDHTRVAISHEFLVNDVNTDQEAPSGNLNKALGPVIAPAGSKSLHVKEWKQGKGSEFVPTLRKFKRVMQMLPARSKHTTWSGELVLVNGHADEFRVGNIWLGYSVRMGTDFFKKTLIVTITPRFMIRNDTKFSLKIFASLVSKMSFTAIGALRETAGIWERAEKYRKASLHHDAELLTSAFVNSADSDFERIPYESTLDVADQLLEDAATTEDVLFAEAVLEKHRRRKLSVLMRDGFTRGVVVNGLHETRPQAIDDANGPGELLNAPTNKEVSAEGSLTTLEPDASVVVYQFGEKSSLTNIYSRAMCLSVGSYQQVSKSKNFLLIKIISARNLTVANSNGASDPFCNIFWQGEGLYRTREQRNTLNPVWKESFILSLPKEDLSSLELRIEVMDYNVSRQNTFLGQVTLRSHDLLYSGGEELSYQLHDKYGNESLTLGAIVFSVLPIARDITRWTPPLRLDICGTEYISVKKPDGHAALLYVSIISSGSMILISIGEHNINFLPAFRIENRTPDMRIRFRQFQTDKIDFDRRTLRPSESCYFGWDDPNLQHAVELVVVDGNDKESQPYIYKLDAVDEHLPPLNATGLATLSPSFQVTMEIKGHTRILKLSAARSDDRYTSIHNDAGSFTRFFVHANFDFAVHGISIVAIDETPRELLNFVIEGVRISSLSESPSWAASVMHVQLDSMMEKAKYPVLLSPLDSGLNSERNQYFYKKGARPIPLLEFVFEPDTAGRAFADAFFIRKFDFRLRPLSLIIDLNFIARLVKAMFTKRIITTFSLLKNMLPFRSQASSSVMSLVTDYISPVEMEYAQNIIFIKAMNLHGVDIQLLLSLQIDKMDIDENRDLSTFSEYSTAIRYLSELSKSVTVINPRFSFFAIKMTNVFERFDDILRRIVFVYISQALVQSYKIFGSMDAIGDPVGVIKEMGSSLKSFLIHSGLELSGQSPVRAEGLKYLVQAIIGSPFGSLGKVTRGVGQFFANISNMEIDIGQESAPEHLGEGLLEAGKVFVDSVHHGVVNVVRNPYSGFKEGSALHALQGTAQGVLGLVLSPAIGAFGAVTKLTQSIDSTTHAFDKKLKGRYRPNRPLFFCPRLFSLPDSVVFQSFEFNVEGLFFPVLDMCRHMYVCISAHYGSYSFCTAAVPCASVASWRGTDCFFRFPTKPFETSFQDDLVVFKIQLLKNQKGHFNESITIAKSKIHPLEMRKHFKQQKQYGYHERDNNEEISTLSSFPEGDAASSVHSITDHDAFRAIGPNKLSRFSHSIFNIKRKALEYPSQILPSANSTEPDTLTQATRPLPNQSLLRHEIVNLSNGQQLISRGGERQHHPLSEQFIVPGSGMTKIPAQMLDPFVTNDIYQLRFNIDDNAIEKIAQLFEKDPLVPSLGDLNDNLEDELTTCWIELTGSYVNALRTNITYAGLGVAEDIANEDNSKEDDNEA